MRITVFIISMLAASCQMLGWVNGESNSTDAEEPLVATDGPRAGTEGAEQETAAADPKPADRNESANDRQTSRPATKGGRSNTDLELKIAKLWARLDELEGQLLQQKERNKLLERGLMLGIVPDELKDKEIAEAEEKIAQQNAKPALSPIVEAPIETKPMSLSAKSLEPKSADVEPYRQKLQKAQDFFNNANYGQAIALYNEIGAQFDESLTEGSHLYWIGLSWFYLKEYKLAETSFQGFRDRYPHNPWVPHAGFYLAKVDQSRGFSQRALEQFQRILDEFPDRDLGEMAKSEIERMREKL